MLARIAEQDRACARAFEVQMRGMLPREAHASVNLDSLGRGVEIRFRTLRLGQMRSFKYVFAVGYGECGVIGGGTCELGFNQHIGAFVLDRLK